MAQQQVFKDEVLARADQRLNAGEEEAEHLKHRLSIADSSPYEVLPSDSWLKGCCAPSRPTSAPCSARATRSWAAALERIHALDTIDDNLTESVGLQKAILRGLWLRRPSSSRTRPETAGPGGASGARESIPALEPAPRLELCARCGSRVCRSTVACAAWTLAIQLVPSHPVVDVSALRTSQPPCWPWPFAPESRPTCQHKSTASRI